MTTKEGDLKFCIPRLPNMRENHVWLDCSETRFFKFLSKIINLSFLILANNFSNAFFIGLIIIFLGLKDTENNIFLKKKKYSMYAVIRVEISFQVKLKLYP